MADRGARAGIAAAGIAAAVAAAVLAVARRPAAVGAAVLAVARRAARAGIAAAVLAVAAAAPSNAARAERFASGVPEPANLAFDDRGALWVASGGHLPRASNGVWLVRRAGARPVQVVHGLYSALGLTWHRGRLYVAHIVRSSAGGHVGRVTAFSGWDGRAFARSHVVVDGLPVGLHRVDSIVAGPGGRLYLGIGSQFDARRSHARLSGTVVSFRPSGRGLRIEARGLRNPYGLAFVPGTPTLLISEHGRDDLGLRRPPEELNVVDVEGPAPDFGFPECFNQGGPACRNTRRPVARLAAHAAPGGVAVVAPSPAKATAYVPQFGSSFPAQPTGGDIVAVRLTRRGGRWHGRTSRFARGLGRQNPLGAAIGPDGALYVSLWTRGRILRYALPREVRPPAARPSPRAARGSPRDAGAEVGPFADLARWASALLAAWR